MPACQSVAGSCVVRAAVVFPAGFHWPPRLLCPDIISPCDVRGSNASSVGLCVVLGDILITLARHVQIPMVNKKENGSHFASAPAGVFACLLTNHWNHN